MINISKGHQTVQDPNKLRSSEDVSDKNYKIKMLVYGSQLCNQVVTAFFVLQLKLLKAVMLLRSESFLLEFVKVIAQSSGQPAGSNDFQRFSADSVTICQQAALDPTQHFCL